MAVRSVSVDDDQFIAPLLTGSNFTRLTNTLLLAGGVLAIVTALAAPMAWLTSRTNMPGRRWLSVLGVLPLAIPGYVMAFALKSVGGYGGVFSEMTGSIVTAPTGYWGSLLCLSAYNLPYMFLTLRAAMFNIDPSLEEAARSLGHGRSRVISSVLVPQLLPAFLAGAMLVILHVIADFGVVSLMRFETLSFDLYYKLESSDLTNASRSGLLLLGLASVFIAVEMFFLRGLRLDRAGTGSSRERTSRLSMPTKVIGLTLFLVVFTTSVVGPTATVIYWAARSAEEVQPTAADDDLANFFENEGAGFQEEPVAMKVRSALIDSVKCSFPAALLAAALAIPIALLRARYPSRRSFLLERLPYVGYATPALAFALSLILFCLWGFPSWLQWLGDALYQSLPLLVYAYALHFLAEAVGPIRSSLYLAGPRMEEASRSLGSGRWKTFWRVTVPVLRHGLIVATALVFLSCMKELPLTMLLSPTGTHTLAMEVWSYSEEGLYGKVAPFALTILLFSAAFVGILLLRGREQRST